MTPSPANSPPDPTPRADHSGVAVLVPCYNEAITVQKVVRDFQAALPGATIYVFDNNSSDGTGDLAREVGATVVLSPRQGKGHVVQHMFSAIDAEIYLMVDGDDTYPAAAAPALLDLYRRTGAGMVVGKRMESFEERSFRRFHQFGNHLVAGLISVFFRTRISDVLSGYRVFSREFAKSVPLVSAGFGIETEMTLQALGKGFAVVETPIAYGTRPEGSFSKLNTYSDGAVVLTAIVMLFKDYRPLVFFGGLSLALAMLAAAAGAAPVLDYLQHQWVYHVPLAILAAAIGILSAVSMSVGLILDTIARYHRENFALFKRVLSERTPRDR